MIEQDYRGSEDGLTFDLYVRGVVPEGCEGSLLVATSRRSKERSHFRRWHDSQTDLVRIDLYPGKPGRIRAYILPIDPTGADVDGKLAESDRRLFGGSSRWGYATQPNHGLNVSGGTLWATNLLFGAPLQVDISDWRPERVLRFLPLSSAAPRVSGTSHFAPSLDQRYMYFHQSLLEAEVGEQPVRAADLTLVRLDTRTGAKRTWTLVPPVTDSALETANFHSAFYFEESGGRYVGLLRTGALLESLAPHSEALDHTVLPSTPSTIWVVRIDETVDTLHAKLLEGIGDLNGLALSHLDVDSSSGDGFVLYANFKEADVAEETHGVNVYGEDPAEVGEHYSGMVVEGVNYGQVVRYERRSGKTSVRTFARPYDPSRPALGHSWLPINIELDPSRQRLFCSFSGFRPRLLPRHVADAYPDRIADMSSIRHVPPVIIRFNAETLQPDMDGGRSHISYAEPIAIAVISGSAQDYVCTFSPQAGLRMYDADDLNRMICRAESPALLHWGDEFFRPEPAHMVFVAR